LVPRAQRIATLINPANTAIYRTGVLERRKDQVNRELKVSMQYIEARATADLPAAFEAAVRARADGLVVTADPVFGSVPETIVKLAEKHRLPTVYPARGYVQIGGLISYSADFREVYRRAAFYVDKIFKGANPADLPVEQPTKFELVINLKTAKTLGLTIPPSLLVRADHLIE
jgi:putative ABC transport system substrate-binding protein